MEIYLNLCDSVKEEVRREFAAFNAFIRNKEISKIMHFELPYKLEEEQNQSNKGKL